MAARARRDTWQASSLCRGCILEQRLPPHCAAVARDGRGVGLRMGRIVCGFACATVGGSVLHLEKTNGDVNQP